jgi:peptidoglycan/xylan/chitin deacetylase (PgdA/CDA1 family)
MRRLVELAERLGIVRALRPLHDRWCGSLSVLAYHRILPVEQPDAYPFDLDLISATPAQFDRQMAFLRRHFHPVSLEDVLAHIEGEASLPPGAVAVTIDDGFNDTHHYAFPILRRYAIPATVFVTTGYVDSGLPFWFEVAAYLALRAAPGSLRLEEYGQAFPAGNSIAERRQSVRALQALLKELPHRRWTAVVGEWSRRFTAEADGDTLALGRPLSWPQVQEMAAAGISFGSHSVTHPNLTQLTDRDLEWELTASKHALESRLQRPVVTLAYPIGTAATFDQRVVAAARQTGFKLGLSYTRGANRLSDLDPYALSRYGIERGHTLSYFRSVTALPSWLT